MIYQHSLSNYASGSFGYVMIGLMILSSCGGNDTAPKLKEKVDVKLFTKLSSTESGIEFKNTMTETPELNYLTYDPFYSGGGVAAGDLNNDGLLDLYFTGNLVQDRLYLNKGDLNFEDITDKAIVTGNEEWHRGVVIVDVNADGWNDIYVCRGGWQQDPDLRSNLLYINNGDLTFTEQAAEFGLDDTGYSTHAAFFDYDLDGDLDVYVLNQPHSNSTTGSLSVGAVRDMIAKGSPASDHLYRNDDGKFIDVSMESGINNYAYSLGIGILDINHDGWPDIYVANDYAEPDFLYVNDGSGKFVDEVKERTPHVSNFGMGVDVGDINNDLEEDIIVVDMAYKSMVRSKKNMGSMAPDKFWAYINAGYHYQYMINTLQLNLGNGHMSEIAQMAGVAKSDWSWASVFEDLDNDGYKDLYISNGNSRDVRNNDLQTNLEQIHKASGGKANFLDIMKVMPEKLVPNAVYQNKGDLTFRDNAKAWGLYDPSTTNGLVIADLDNDGDMDIVGNRQDTEADLYRNETDRIGKHHFLQVELNGSNKNPRGVGSRVIVTQGDSKQLYMIAQSRGYQSGFQPLAHFGFGENESPVDVQVTFPDGRTAIQTGVALDQRINVNWSEALPIAEMKTRPSESLMAETEVYGLSTFKHNERNVNDFIVETLLPQKYSQLGPFFSTADVNGDGNTDLFVSGAAGMSSQLFLGTTRGFKASSGQPFSQHKEAEDLGSVFLDSDGDGDQDLLVLAGGNEHEIGNELMFPRLYLNNGAGKYSLAQGKLPEIITSAMKAAAGDYDGDGDIDLFIAGRNTPGHYPFSPRSYLLNNQGGVFVDVTGQTSPDLMGPGMITDVEFADMDDDGDLDLVAAGEWMPISVFINEGGNFKNTQAGSNLSHTNGWWYSIEIADLNGDGKLDIAAGNLGKNTKYHASNEEPFHVYWADFDQNGVHDIVLAMHQNNQVYPVRGRECTSGQMPFVKQKFPTFEAFAEANLAQVYNQQNLDNALHLKAYELESCVFINSGGLNYEKIKLPTECQMAPVNDIISKDINADGKLDLILAGNNYDTEVETVRYDGGTGLVLTGDGDGKFEPTSVSESGFYANGNCKDLELVEINGTNVLLVANNGDKIQAFSLNVPVQ